MPHFFLCGDDAPRPVPDRIDDFDDDVLGLPDGADRSHRPGCRHERAGRAVSRRGAVGYLGAQGEARLLGCILVGTLELGEDFCLERREGKPGIGSGGPHPSPKAEAGHGVGG